MAVILIGTVSGFAVLTPPLPITPSPPLPPRLFQKSPHFPVSSLAVRRFPSEHSTEMLLRESASMPRKSWVSLSLAALTAVTLVLPLSIARAQENNDLPAQAGAILARYCARCHRGEGSE